MVERLLMLPQQVPQKRPAPTASGSAQHPAGMAGASQAPAPDAKDKSGALTLDFCDLLHLLVKPLSLCLKRPAWKFRVTDVIRRCSTLVQAEDRLETCVLLWHAAAEEWDAILDEKRRRLQSMMDEYEERKVGGHACARGSRMLGLQISLLSLVLEHSPMQTYAR